MRNPNPILCIFLIAVTAVTSSAATGDADNDGLRDSVETHTGIFRSASDTGTNPYVSDSDGDSMPDGMEVSLGTNPTNSESKIKRPNIIYIMADDLAYGELGCFGQNQRTGIWKFQTPGLDTMAAEGAMLTHHYASAPICVSSRCSFLEGRSQGHASIRDGQFDFPIPAGHLLASTLKQAGYKTIHIGKAGLTGKDQFKPTAHPMDRGFDHFFGLLTHAECHEHYPRNGTTETKSTIYNDRTPVTGAHMDLYTSDAWTGYAKNLIIQESQANPGRPFFIYLAYDTPHFWGSTPPTKAYPTGRGLNGGIQWTGAPSYVNTATNDPTKVNNPANVHASVSSSWYPDAQKYVTMIRRLDDSVADILQTLKDLGVADNTLVVFTSDNGASQIGYDPRSFGGYGDFEGIKGDLLEGGIRVPTIAWWPNTIPATQSVSNTRKIDHPSANYDWFATFAAAARFPIPAYTDGTSLLPSLTGVGAQSSRGFLYFEMYTSGNTPDYPEFPNHRNQPRGNMQAIRIGDFMGVRTAISSANDPFMIYDVVHDPRQSVNLAQSQPQLQQEMQRLAVGARRPVSSTSRPYDTAQIPAYTPSSPVRKGLKWKSYEGYWPWLPEFRTLTPTASGDTAGIGSSMRSRNVDFGLSFEGYLSISTAGSYNFQISSDSGASLWLHESHVLDNEADHLATKTSTPVYLSSGLHPIRLFYRHQDGPISLDLKYSGPGLTLQSVPPAVFYQDGRPTVLQPDTFTVSRNSNKDLDVLANDSAEVPLTLRNTTTASYGSTAISNGRVTYTPNANMIGTDIFSYQANDGVSDSSATVTGTILFENEIWFPLNEGRGFTVSQMGGTAAGTGQLVGPTDPAASWVAGKSGTALHFQGINDMVIFQNVDFPSGSAPRTFSCWFRTATGASGINQTLLSYGSDTFGGRFTIRLAPSGSSGSSQTLCVESQGGVVSGNTPVNDAAWHHLAVTAADLNNNNLITMDEIRLFVDGIPETANVSSPGVVMTVTGFPPALGGSNHAANYRFAGDIDDLRIFPRALGAAEVADLKSSVPTGPGIVVNSEPPSPDSDGDGFSNNAEITAGTDPQNPNSYPKISSIQLANQSIILTWNGISGRSYQFEESADLSNWAPVANLNPVVMAENTLNATVSIPTTTATKRFFRIKVDLAQTVQPAADTATVDSDSDGMSDSDEYIAGTNSNDRSSKLTATLSLSSDGTPTIRWNGIAGRTYRVEESLNLQSWITAPGTSAVAITTDTSNLSIRIPKSDAPRRFFRLGVSLTR